MSAFSWHDVAWGTLRPLQSPSPSHRFVNRAAPRAWPFQARRHDQGAAPSHCAAAPVNNWPGCHDHPARARCQGFQAPQGRWASAGRVGVPHERGIPVREEPARRVAAARPGSEQADKASEARCTSAHAARGQGRQRARPEHTSGQCLHGPGLGWTLQLDVRRHPCEQHAQPLAEPAFFQAPTAACKEHWAVGCLRGSAEVGPAR